MTDRRWAQPILPRDQLTVGYALDDAVPAGHPIRILDTILNELDWTEWFKAYDSDRRGQPPIHPRLLAGCVLYGVMRKIRSSRELEEATRERADFRWFLEGRTVDHSTFANFRLKFDYLLKALNGSFAQRICSRHENALETLVVDGTRIRANSNRHGARTQEGLKTKIARFTDLINERLKEVQERDKTDSEQILAIADMEQEIEQLRQQIAHLEKAADVAKQRDEARRKKMGAKAPPASVPVTDPDASIVPNKEGGFAPNYTPTVAVDAASGAIISCGVPEGARESEAVMPAVADAQALGGEPKRVMADTAFSGGENLRQLDAQGIEACMPTGTDFSASNPANREDPCQPVPEEQREQLPKSGGKFNAKAFVYDAELDEYRCPMGKPLLPGASRQRRNGAMSVTYTCHNCGGCPLAQQCLAKGSASRTIARDEYQDLREKTGRRMAREEEAERYKSRAPLVEVVFARIKQHMGVRQFLLRGLKKVRAEWNWVCCAYNLKILLQTVQNEKELDMQAA